MLCDMAHCGAYRREAAPYAIPHTVWRIGVKTPPIYASHVCDTVWSLRVNQWLYQLNQW